MTTINNKLAVDIPANVALQVEPLEKVAKMGHKTVELAATFTAVSEPFMALCEHLKGTVAFFETVQFVGRIKELICLDDKGNSFFSVNTWQKCTDRVTLAIHSSMKAVRTLAKMGLVNLGRLGANIAGKLTIFSFVTDVFILASSSFSIWDNVINVTKARKSAFGADAKIEKWEYRKTLIAQVESGVQSEIQALQNKYEQKIEKVNNTAYTTAEKAAELQQAILKYDQRLNLIKNRDNLGLADQLKKTDLAYKEKKWNVIKNNAVLDRNKAYLGIANSSFKIGVVSLAIVLSATNFWANIALRPLLLGGIVTDSIGFTKFFYGHYNKREPLPPKPVAVV